MKKIKLIVLPMLAIILIAANHVCNENDVKLCSGKIEGTVKQGETFTPSGVNAGSHSCDGSGGGVCTDITKNHKVSYSVIEGNGSILVVATCDHQCPAIRGTVTIEGKLCSCQGCNTVIASDETECDICKEEGKAHGHCWVHCPACINLYAKYEAQRLETNNIVKQANDKIRLYNDKATLYEQQRSSYMEIASAAKTNTDMALLKLEIEMLDIKQRLSQAKEKVLAIELNIREYEHELDLFYKKNPGNLSDLKKEEEKQLKDMIQQSIESLKVANESLETLSKAYELAKDAFDSGLEDIQGFLDQKFEILFELIEKVDVLSETLRSYIQRVEAAKRMLEIIKMDYKQKALEHLEEVTPPKPDLLEEPRERQELPERVIIQPNTTSA